MEKNLIAIIPKDWPHNYIKYCKQLAKTCHRYRHHELFIIFKRCCVDKISTITTDETNCIKETLSASSSSSNLTVTTDLLMNLSNEKFEITLKNCSKQ